MKEKELGAKWWGKLHDSILSLFNQDNTNVTSMSIIAILGGESKEKKQTFICRIKLTKDTFENLDGEKCSTKKQVNLRKIILYCIAFMMNHCQ